MRKYKQLTIFTFLFVILNWLGTYTLTTTILNEFIITFSRSVMTEINSIVGNVAVLLIIVTIVFMIAKKPNTRMRTLLIITFLLNVTAIALWAFMRYYQTPFSFRDWYFAKNKADGEMSGSMFWGFVKDLIVRWRIIALAPFAILLIVFIVFRVKDRRVNSIIPKAHYKIRVMPMKKKVLALVIFCLISFGTFKLGEIHVNKNWPIDHDRALYGMQSTGIFNFYVYDILGYNWTQTDQDEPFDYKVMFEYDTNQESYTNIFGETHSNDLKLSDAPTVWVDPKIEQESLTGILEGKNVVFVQLETFNEMFLDDNLELFEGLLPNFRHLISESYYFENFYSVVGLGHSSDAEFSALTGLYPNGKQVIFWEYGNETYQQENPFIEGQLVSLDKQTDYHLNALPEVLSDYYSASFHADTRFFYNRFNVHPGMLGFDDFFHYTKGEERDLEHDTNVIYRFPDHLETFHPKSPWLSEKSLFDWTTITGKEKSAQNEPYFFFPITVHPHVPFDYDPYIDTPLFTTDDIKVSPETMKMLNYLRYYDDKIKMITDMAKELTNTVYVIYADHGTSFAPEEMKTIYNDPDMGEAEIWRKLYQVPALIYAPDDDSDLDVKPGLIKGRQPKVRSQIDLYRTILELLGRNDSNFYYGVHGMSEESSFAYQTKINLIVTDDFTISLKKYKPYNVLNKNSYTQYVESIDYDIDKLIDEIIKFKNINDLVLEENMFERLNNDKKEK